MNAATIAGHTCSWSVGQENAAVAMPMIRLRSGRVGPSCWNNWRTLTTPLRGPSAVQNLLNAWTYRSVLIATNRSLWSSHQNGPMMPYFEMATQAVHFTECIGLCRQCSGGVLRQKMLFLEFTWPDNRKCASWTGNSRHPKRSLNCNWSAWIDFCRKYASTINIFCSVVHGISKVKF